MKKLVIMLICSSSLLLQFTVIAQENPDQEEAKEGSLIQETKTHNLFKGLFLKVWSKLRSLNPSLKQSARTVEAYTVGIRGAESTDTLLQPYWKDDLSQDEAFQQELQQFTLAQRKLDQGDLQAAVSAFDQFIDTYQESSLRPNALFARALSLAGLGQIEFSLASLLLFIEENPQHPLIEEARQIIDELGG